MLWALTVLSPDKLDQLVSAGASPWAYIKTQWLLRKARDVAAHRCFAGADSGRFPLDGWQAENEASTADTRICSLAR